MNNVHMYILCSYVHIYYVHMYILCSYVHIYYVHMYILCSYVHIMFMERDRDLFIERVEISYISHY